MKERIERSALVWHPAEDMFRLVNDIPRYPEFLPWCSDARVHERNEDRVTASLVIAKGGISQSFTTCNWLEHPQRIGIELVDGPFTQLQGEWRFQCLDQRACKVILQLDFALQGRVSRLAFGNVFSQVANTMVDAFCQRADSIYGKKRSG